MMRKARLAIRKVNVALDSPGYCFGNVSLPFTRTVYLISERNVNQEPRNPGKDYGDTGLATPRCGIPVIRKLRVVDRA
jgi:hypothetical protein